MQNYHQPLLHLETYHLFSRAVGNEKIFIEERNYPFSKKLASHTSDIANILTYSLLPNHFHIERKIKPFECVAEHFENEKKKPIDPFEHQYPRFHYGKV